MSLWRPIVRDGRGRKISIRAQPEHQAMWGLGAMGAYLAVAAAVLIRGQLFLPAAIALAMMGVALVLAFTLRRDQRGERLLQNTWLCHGRCPSCEYDIAEIPQQADGCTVCPECGAAWKMPAARENADREPPVD